VRNATRECEIVREIVTKIRKKKKKHTIKRNRQASTGMEVCPLSMECEMKSDGSVCPMNGRGKRRRKKMKMKMIYIYIYVYIF